MKTTGVLPPHAAGQHAVRVTAAAAMALSALLAAGSAAAQETPVPASAEAKAAADAADKATLDTVTVTGIRKSAESAQNLKKKSDQVVDAIVAEDIGKFPDKNVAELLGRVTGVQIQRGNGEAGNVIVRGLGGIVTLLNGREFFSDAGRSLWLADIPATMLQRIEVYKTQAAEQPEGGTAGVIDVRTNRPFDFKDTQVYVNGRMEHRDKAKVNNPDLSGMASSRWMTSVGEFGALAGLSYQNGQYHDERAWVGDPEIIKGVVSSCCVGRVLDLGDRKRLAANFALQWKPSADTEVYLEGFGTRIDHDYQMSFLVAGIPDPFLPNTVVTVKPGTQNLDRSVNTNYNGWGFTSTQGKRDTVGNNQLALGGSWNVDAQWRLSTELARTSSHITWANRILDTAYEPKSTVAAVRDGGGFIDYPGLDMTNPANFKISGGVDVHGRRTGESTDWRADASFEPEAQGFFKEFATGLRLAQRNASSIATNQPWQNAGPNVNKVVSGFPGVADVSPATWGDFGVKSYVYASRDWLLNNPAEFRKLITGSDTVTPFDPLTYFDNDENTRAAYGRAKFGFNLAGVPVTGVAGLRVVRTSQELRGNSRDLNNVISPVHVKTQHTDTLPSLSMKAQLTPEVYARLVAGKTIERPAFGDYNPGLQLFPPGGGVSYGSGTAGNPYLKPTESNNVDVALEWYFARTGSLTGTLFDHRFKNRLARSTQTERYNGLDYLVNRPYNLNKANLKGYEISYRQFYDFLPGWLGGFGLEANFTYMTGEQTGPDGTTTPFLGQSKTAYNLVGLYERNDFYARLAYNWRAKFLAEKPYRSTGRELYVAALRTLDASLGYNLSKQTTVTLDVTNLLNQAYHDYFDQNPSLVRDVRYYDRTVGVSVRWKL